MSRCRVKTINNTANKATDAANSVVNSFGQCHELPNLYIAGPSIFPTEGASNPTYTILAVSLRGAEQLAAKWATVAG